MLSLMFNWIDQKYMVLTKKSGFCKRGRGNGVASFFSCFLPFKKVFPCFLSVFFPFFRVLPFFRSIFRKKKQGDAVRETPFAKPRRNPRHLTEDLSAPDRAIEVRDRNRQNSGCVIGCNV